MTLAPTLGATLPEAAAMTSHLVHRSLVHAFDELAHHGAEIALLRDLYRASAPPIRR